MTTGKVLIVDNDEVMLELAISFLVPHGYDCVTVSTGLEAKEILESGDHMISVVVLDLFMPDMDGFDVLMTIQRSKHLSSIPVIIQSASAHGYDVAKALDNGAFYYLPKPFDKDVLLAVVRSAFYHRMRVQLIDHEHRDLPIYTSYIQHGTYQFKTPSDVYLLARLLAYACPKPHQVFPGLTELMMNAIEHGNLEIHDDLKAQLVAQKGLADEIAQRLEHPQYRDRVARISVYGSPEEIVYRIEDQGKGFDWAAYMHFDQDRTFNPNGRGIMVAKLLSFDTLTYHDPGNALSATVRL